MTGRYGAHSADTCREQGWTVGTRLVGDEGCGPTVIEITAIGRAQMLAVTISHRGRPDNRSGESSWALWCRDWQEVVPCGRHHDVTENGLTVEWTCAASGDHDECVDSRGEVIP